MADNPLPRRNYKGKLAPRGHFILVKQRGRIGNRFQSDGVPSDNGNYHLRKLGPPRKTKKQIRREKSSARRIRREKRREKREKKRAEKTERRKEILEEELPQADVESAEASGRSGATFATYFKAAGTFGSYESLTKTKARKGHSPSILNEDAEDYGSDYGVPAAFFSQQSLILGQVKWDGVLSLDELISLLNRKLQFSGTERDDFDFRDVYPVWSYSYQVIEFVGIKKNKIAEASDSRGV